jgi:hypothetical protein
MRYGVSTFQYANWRSLSAPRARIMQAAIPYHEPSIARILIYASFLLLLNVVDWAVNGVLHCGPVGQILVGVAWGAPGGKLLSVEAQEVIVQIGYLGLILIVYEGKQRTRISRHC